MNNDDHISHLNISSSYKPINKQNTSYLSTSTLKNTQDSNLPNRLNKNRRKSIIPLSHLPTKSYKIFEMYNETDNSFNKNYSLEETEQQSQPSTNTTSTSQTNNNYDNNDLLPIEKNENLINKEETDVENSFDSFIIQNFTPFYGGRDVNLWLHETEKKFRGFLIPRNLRFTAIPLLVEGPAKKVYILNRRNIQSFEDFHELLLVHFDKNVVQSTLTDQQESVFSQSSLLHQVKSSEDKNLQTMMTFDNTNFSEKPPKHHSTALNDSGAVASSGEIPAFQSTVVNDNNTINHSTTTFDDTTNAIRKVLLHNLIKNPKTFQGGKDDVTKWLEDLEHLFDTAHIPDAKKLDLISYSLRGEALRWYKNNKSTLTSWHVFVHELKKAFTSSYHEELAFKKLESYTQGENQSICNFYNEVLKLCKEADSTMSESTKLKNLLNKTKPTIQFEVRRKKPTTTKEFLEHAKEIEELYQLSNISINNNTHTNTLHIPTTSSTVITPTPNYYNNSPFFVSKPQRWERPDYNYYNNNRQNNFRISNTLPSPASSFRPRNPTFSSTKPLISMQSQQNYAPRQFRTNQQRSSNNCNNQSYIPRYPRVSSRDKPRQNTVNNLIPSDNLPQLNPQQTSEPTNCCVRCNQFGHRAISCPNF
ncbi:unnamed protein product [Rotaria sp. Silwood2]|nr:unnamed protein product [Rotaria sp. Silwood2]CAF4668061.1 unnamed protein product [Rotaria sp. Silwood2]